MGGGEWEQEVLMAAHATHSEEGGRLKVDSELNFLIEAVCVCRMLNRKTMALID
jgi:hypothetical protein